MSLVKSKPFRPGTTGWTASDLDDPRIEAKREWGRYEIINGVLTKMPPAYFIGGEMLANVIGEFRQQLKVHKIPGSFSIEADMIIDEQRVVKGDSCFMTPEDKKKQRVEAKKHGKPDPDRARVYVPPTIIIESIAPGHQAHDRVTKFEVRPPDIECRSRAQRKRHSPLLFRDLDRLQLTHAARAMQL